MSKIKSMTPPRRLDSELNAARQASRMANLHVKTG